MSELSPRYNRSALRKILTEAGLEPKRIANVFERNYSNPPDLPVYKLSEIRRILDKNLGVNSSNFPGSIGLAKEVGVHDIAHAREELYARTQYEQGINRNRTKFRNNGVLAKAVQAYGLGPAKTYADAETHLVLAYDFHTKPDRFAGLGSWEDKVKRAIVVGVIGTNLKLNDQIVNVIEQVRFHVIVNIFGK